MKTYQFIVIAVLLLVIGLSVSKTAFMPRKRYLMAEDEPAGMEPAPVLSTPL